MRVTIDLTPAVQGHAGMGRYADELARALYASCPKDETLGVFYTDPQRRQPAAPLDRLPRTSLAMSNKPWRMRVLLAQCLRWPQDGVIGRPDLFLATDHLLPYSRRVGAVFTLHDLTFRNFPAAHLPLNRWFFGLMVPVFLDQADAIVVDSECTRRDAIQIYRVPPDKLHVVYAAANARFRPAPDRNALLPLQERYSLPERFLLYVSTIEPRKNLPTLFEAMQAAGDNGLPLVITGRKGWRYEQTFARLRELGIERQVIFTGFVSDEDLPGLYALADAFVFPSLYEGFGLPVLEAMACGTPVISSNASSLPEVTGDATLLVPPTEVRGWVEAITRIAADRALRADLSQRGLRQAARFSWDRAATQTREIYRDVYARRT